MTDNIIQDPFQQFEMQKELVEKQGQEQQKLYIPQLQEQVNQLQAAIIAQTDPKDDIEGLLNEFRGMEKVEGKLKQVRDAIMNEAGIERVSQILRPLMINTVRFTRLRSNTIKNFTFQIVDDLTYDLGKNWREYEIDDRSSCDHIVNSVAILVFSMLSRAEDQNEKNWAGKIVIENLSPNKTIGKKEASWLERFKL